MYLAKPQPQRSAEDQARKVLYRPGSSFLQPRLVEHAGTSLAACQLQPYPSKDRKDPRAVGKEGNYRVYAEIPNTLW